jgi:membrane-bound lytic murein transglycosylase D
MSGASLALLNAYLCANALMVVAVALLMAIGRVNARLTQTIAYRQQLRLGYVLTAAALFLPFIGGWSASPEFTARGAQVWSAPTMHSGSSAGEIVAVALVAPDVRISLDSAVGIGACLLIAGLMVLVLRMTRDAIGVVRVIHGAQAIRRQGSVRVLSTEQAVVPFSFWVPSKKFIVVPAGILLNVDHLRLAIRHEAQHHRQGDTRALYCYQLLRGLFFWNPAAHALSRLVRQLQEYACDEAVVARRGAPVSAYCRCLLAVAEQAVPGRALLSARMADHKKSDLQKRIAVLLLAPRGARRWPLVTGISVLSLGCLGAASMLLAATVQDRRIDMAQAQRMAEVARQNSTFPIVVNDSVLEQLNLLLATPDGRGYVQASLARMQAHQPLIAEQLARYRLPPELLAVPLVESGYRNLPANTDRARGAGLWMFIEPTAKRYGLQVTKQIDQRLDVEQETDAALRMFADLQREFNDWHLALLAYNAGNAKVTKGMRATGSADAWQLIRSGYENDRGYLPRLMAAMLIIKNPSLAE